MRPSVVLLVALLLVGSAGTVVSIPQSSEYSMSSPAEVEIPARNLTVDGDDYTVRAVGRVVPGDTVQVDVSASESAEYSVYLYNEDLRIEDTASMSGSDSATFSTNALSPGSYLAAVYDGGILEVLPVVVEGYEVTADAPASADGEFTADVTVADGALTSEPPEVQVVLGGDGRSVRATASRVADGEYRATLPTDGFEDGTYALYGVVRGEETTEGGDRVILAMSDGHEVRLETGSTATPTATASDGGGGGGGGQPGDDDGGEVEIRDASLLNGTVETDQAVVVRVDLANPDPTRGRITLALAADGETVAERTVAVGASTRRTVFVRTRFDTAGTYRLALDGEEVGTVTVTTAPTGTATTERPTETTTQTPTDEAVVTPRPTTAAPSPSPSPATTGGDGAGFDPAIATLAVVLAALAFGRR
ncbi:MAG: hypothetical protein V5A62_06725 [Haloarculaceae archaeon]